MEEGYVGYTGKFEGILTNQSYRREKGDRACTKPMGNASSKNDSFQGQQQVVYGWLDGSYKLHLCAR